MKEIELMDLSTHAFFSDCEGHKAALKQLLSMSPLEQSEKVERMRQNRVSVMKDLSPKIYSKEEAKRQIDEVSLEYIISWHASAAIESARRDILKILKESGIEVKQ